MLRKIAVAVAAFVGAGALTVAVEQPVYAWDNGVARTPPMGWNQWNTFGCAISDALVRQAADRMVVTGRRDAGYAYVNIDDCWMARHRDSAGNLVADPAKFPNGMRAVADYVHSRGLKLGIYSSAGTATCQGFPASLNHEQADAKLWASWGIDYLKYDNCNNQGVDARQRYTKMRDALAATGRPIVYSICEWGQNQPWQWAKPVGNLWRTTGDITDNWSSVLRIYKRNVSQTPLGILGNRDVVAFDQDARGVQAREVRSTNGLHVLSRPLANGGYAVALFNETNATATISATAVQAGLPAASSYRLFDVWSKANTTTTGTISASVPPHGTVAYRITPAT